jgi:hypothetical protein
MSLWIGGTEHVGAREMAGGQLRVAGETEDACTLLTPVLGGAAGGGNRPSVPVKQHMARIGARAGIAAELASGQPTEDDRGGHVPSAATFRDT